MGLLYQDGKDLLRITWSAHHRNQDAFLYCPGPSLANTIEGQNLRAVGAFTCVVNTAYPTVEPDLWVCMDGAQCYDRSVWMRNFRKVIGTKYLNDSVAGRRLWSYPDVFFAEGHDGGLQEMFARSDANAPFLWRGNVFWIALHMLVWMGFKRIHLVGCDFGGAKDYFHDLKLNDVQRKYNLDLYAGLVRDLGFVAQEGKKHGVEFVSCTPNSPANAVVPYVPLSDALLNAGRHAPTVTRDVVEHGSTAELSQWRPTGSLGERGVITGCDAKMEWMLDWWWEHYQAHNDHPVAFADFGMSKERVEWCKARGSVYAITEKMPTWFKKPIAMLRSPFETTAWIDLDCEVRKDVGPLFNFAQRGLAVTEDNWTPFIRADQPKLATGVVAAKRFDPIVSEWSEHALSGNYRGDQESLCAFAGPRLRAGQICIMPYEYQALRMAGPAKDATIYHWTGPVGHDHIKSLSGGEYEFPKVSILMPAYNAEAYVAEAIQTCINQSYQNWELIVVDDCSTDGTWAKIEAMAARDSRIRCFLNDENHGYAENVNVCLSRATGELIARMDADDVQDTRRIEACAVTLHNSKGQADLVTCEAAWMSKTGVVGPPLQNKGMDTERYVQNDYTAGPCNATVMAWRWVYKRVGGFRKEVEFAADGDWNLRAIAAGLRWGHVSHIMYGYRQHESQMGKRDNGLRAAHHKKALARFHQETSEHRQEKGKESKDDELSKGELGSADEERQSVRAALSRIT